MHSCLKNTFKNLYSLLLFALYREMQSLQQKRKPSGEWTERKPRSGIEGWSQKARSSGWVKRSGERGKRHRFLHQTCLSQKTLKRIWPNVQQRTVSSRRGKRWASERKWAQVNVVTKCVFLNVFWLVSLCFRCTGFSVTAVTAGSIWFVWVYRQNSQQRRITCVWPAAQQTQAAGSDSDEGGDLSPTLSSSIPSPGCVTDPPRFLTYDLWPL